jgi:hypothetical protein
MERPKREVEFAVGFVGGQWREVSITVEEDPTRVMEDDELVAAATETLELIDFESPVAFYHVLHIEDPEGGFGEDLGY